MTSKTNAEHEESVEYYKQFQAHVGSAAMTTKLLTTIAAAINKEMAVGNVAEAIAMLYATLNRFGCSVEPELLQLCDPALTAPWSRRLEQPSKARYMLLEDPCTGEHIIRTNDLLFGGRDRLESIASGRFYSEEAAVAEFEKRLGHPLNRKL